VRRFYAELYSMLSGIAAISDEDAQRFRAGIRRGERGAVEIVTAGDTRFDQVCRRIDSSTVKLPAPLLGRGEGTVVAGSTWPKDEEVVIPGFRMLRESHPGLTLTIAPHEPTAERLAEISGALAREGLPFRLLSTIADGAAVEEPVVVADGVGYLAELYRSGTIAYVGGSFTTGVHNVMEPAVLGLPLFFGPRIQNSYEARRLVELGVGAVVRSGLELARGASALLDDRERLARSGEAGSAFIRNHCGAARHCVDLMLRHMERRKAHRE
jgi:3-deoxy-D-manno-octulosonic-acid transferase